MVRVEMARVRFTVDIGVGRSKYPSRRTRLLHADRAFNRQPGCWGCDGRIPFTSVVWHALVLP
jgi:hypothetical protein